MNTATKVGPLEVWLSQENMQVTCRIVREDESTTSWRIDSLTIRGAEREVTGDLISRGYRPAGRWETEGGGEDGVEVFEVSRRFAPTDSTEAI